jgi:hypothetical protein
LGGTRLWTFPFLAKLTLEPWVQLQAGSNGFTAAVGDVPARYFDDAQLGLKFHLVDQGPIVPSVSLSATASLPTFDGDGYLRTTDALFIAYVTKDLGPIHADLNVGENLWRIERDARPQEWVALALSTNLPQPLSLMAVMVESYYFTDAAPVDPRDAGLLFALAHSPTPYLTFDCGGDVGYFPSTRAYSVFVGMSIVPILLWGAPP